MDSGWAVVIGAVVAFVGSVLGPAFLSSRTRKAEEERARLDELARLIPELIALITTHQRPAIDKDEPSKLVRLNILLRPSDAGIGSMFTSAASPQNRNADVAGVLTVAVTGWYRGNLSTDRAVAFFEQQTGLQMPRMGILK